MIIPIKTSPRKTLSKVEKKFFFFFFLAGVVFFLGCLLGAGVGSDGSAATASQDLLMELDQPSARSWYPSYHQRLPWHHVDD